MERAAPLPPGDPPGGDGRQGGQDGLDGNVGAHDGLTERQLAERATVHPSRVVELTAAGLVRPRTDGTYDPRDVHRVRLADAFIRAGIPTEVLVEAERNGEISFESYDRLHPPTGRPSERTWGELLRSLGDRATWARRWFGAVGLAEPLPDGRLEAANEALVLEMVDILAELEDPDVALRIARVQGQAAERVAGAALSGYAEAVTRMLEREGVTWVPSPEPFERWLVPWARFARLAPELARWVGAQHLSAAIDAFSVEQTEGYLGRRAYVPPRSTRPTTVAFVDISGFTALAERVGDAAAARVAAGFAELADETTREAGGRLVKLLGDGVLLRFDDPVAGVAATLRLLARMPQTGLPSGHAGLAAGSVVERDGDVFGRVVNLAARIADIAGPGELLLPTELALTANLDAALGTVVELERRGPTRLPGLGQDTELVRVLDRTAG